MTAVPAPAPAAHCACPKCGSENVGSLMMIHLAGTSSISGSAATLGGAVGGRSGLGVTLMTGAIQTNLAKLVAPPAAKGGAIIAIAVVGGGILAVLIMLGICVCMALLSQEPSDRGGMAILVVGVLVFAASIAGGVLQANEAKKWNREQLPRLVAAWRRRWLCMACGGEFEPPLPPA